MALNFRQPNFPVPQYQGIANLGLTLDSIINAYQQAKRMKMQDDLQAQMRGQEQQRYGQQQARQDIMDTASLGFSPTQAAAGAPDAISALNAHLARKQQSEQMGLKKEQAQIDELGRRTSIKPPAGYRYSADGLTMEPVPGGPAAQKVESESERKQAAVESAELKASTVIDAAKKAKEAIGFTTTGVLGKVASFKPGSKRMALEGYLNTIKANLSFDELTKMRQASKTGGALGAVSDRELGLLGSAVASLDPDQEDTILAANIDKVMTHYNNWLASVQKAKKGKSAPAEKPKQANDDPMGLFK